MRRTIFSCDTSTLLSVLVLVFSGLPEVHRLLYHDQVVRAPVPRRVNGRREGGPVLMSKQLFHGLPDG